MQCFCHSIHILKSKFKFICIILPYNNRMVQFMIQTELRLQQYCHNKSLKWAMLAISVIWTGGSSHVNYKYCHLIPTKCYLLKWNGSKFWCPVWYSHSKEQIAKFSVNVKSRTDFPLSLDTLAIVFCCCWYLLRHFPDHAGYGSGPRHIIQWIWLFQLTNLCRFIS